MAHEVVNAYTLVVGESDEGPTLSVHSNACEAWRSLDAHVRPRCGLRPRPRERMDPDATAELANSWRAGDPESRYWNLTVHPISVPLPEMALARGR